MFKAASLLRLSLVAFAILLFAVQPSSADEESDWLKELKSSSPEPGLKKARSSDDDYFEFHTEGKSRARTASPTVNNQNPVSMRTHAAAMLKDGKIDAAMKLIEQTLELTPDDNVARQIFADALEQKLKDQSKRDPRLFNLCVKQWYYLYKNAEYPDMVQVAGNHLRDLTGKSPYVWPTAKMYLGRVLMPEDTETQAGKIAAEEPPLVH